MTATTEYDYDELCDQFEELDREYNNFCTECSDVSISYERLEHFGASCAREEASCPANFDPDYPDCPRHREYVELEQKRKGIGAEMLKLEMEEI